MSQPPPQTPDVTVLADADTIFRSPARPGDFAFDAKVSSVFDDMVSRSVPHYADVQRMLADLTFAFIPERGGVVCDLGCSTGTTIDLLAAHPRRPEDLRFIGLDNSPHMLERARAKLAPIDAAGALDLRLADLNDEPEIPACNVALLNWTLQFVRPLHRESLLRRVHDALEPSGALLMAEKVLVSDSFLNRAYIDFYYDYKRRTGYTDEEIQRKREALENVLVPYRVEENVAMLRRCGFHTVDVFFRWFNFAAFVAVKDA
ncbi:MAG: carboxy-S-adenosyl-L-methionine synthase CmoA [Planctomycetota bacterium]|nr:MAG: carboxy-S-adenosyl-L-methionine synthase CmoA [Planctomycetota bacterium]